MELHIRAAGPDSFAGIAGLELSLNRSEWNVEGVRSTLDVPVNQGLIAVKDTLQVGHLIYAHVIDELEILTIAVDDDHRRQGIARKLIERASALTSARVMHLEVRQSNKPAIALYRGLGFLEVGRRPAYYRCGEDALVMRATPGGVDVDN